jgi:hypothetical protein
VASASESMRCQSAWGSRSPLLSVGVDCMCTC